MTHSVSATSQQRQQQQQLLLVDTVLYKFDCIWQECHFIDISIPWPLQFCEHAVLKKILKASIGTKLLFLAVVANLIFSHDMLATKKDLRKKYFKSVKFCSTLISAKNFFWLKNNFVVKEKINLNFWCATQTHSPLQD